MKNNVKILVVGSGGREHAIAKALLQSPHVAAVFCAPGNVGMQNDGIRTVDICELAFDALKGFVIENEIEWTFVGPENALVAGIVDSFQADGLKILGPNKRAAQLEGSKDYAMRFMEKYQVPTAKFATYQDSKSAIAGLEQFGEPVVIKADGLAAGKGVVIAQTKQEACLEIKLMFKKGQKQIVLEEFLDGDEYSLFVLTNQKNWRVLPLAQDHKRAFDNDQGPNTGGMGAYSPVPQLLESDYQKMLTQVVKPTIAGLNKGKYQYCGIIYIGLILTKQGPKVIEYNVRLGDPETQVILPRISNDFFTLLDTCVNELELPQIKESSQAVLGVVLAANGYPKEPIKNQVLPVLNKTDVIDIDYANVKSHDEAFMGNGGRLLTVISQGDNLIQAQKQAYQYLNEFDFDGCFYRKDIGFKATNYKF